MISPPPLSTQVSMRNMEVVDEVCRSALGCGGHDQALAAFAVLAGLFTLMVLAAMVQLSEAITIVDEERSRIADERDAFEAFTRRVAALEPAESTVAVPAAGGLAATSTGRRDAGLAPVTTAYRETVMAVDHYEADYGEPLAANLAAELGEDLAVAVVEGGELTPPLQSALVEASREASRNRAAFLRTLDAEADALADAEDELRAIDREREAVEAVSLTGRSFEELVEEWRGLGRLVDRCRALAEDRQERIRSRPSVAPSTELALQEYLYGPLPVSHPVLAEVSSLVEGVEDARRRVLHSITRRV